MVIILNMVGQWIEIIVLVRSKRLVLSIRLHEFRFCRTLTICPISKVSLLDIILVLWTMILLFLFVNVMNIIEILCVRPDGVLRFLSRTIRIAVAILLIIIRRDISLIISIHIITSTTLINKIIFVKPLLSKIQARCLLLCVQLIGWCYTIKLVCIRFHVFVRDVNIICHLVIRILLATIIIWAGSLLLINIIIKLISGKIFLVI